MLEDGIKRSLSQTGVKQNKHKIVSEHNTLEIQRKYLIQLSVHY